jgi:UDP-N-acetylglucosamine 2-epimerase (non-hydrolysing)
MKKITLIVGTRPNFMKAYPVYEALKNDFNLTLIHTGQHFSPEMSDIFFKQLGFPKPDIHFELKNRTKSGDFDTKLYINNTDYIKNLDKVIKDLLNYDATKLGQLGEIKNLLKQEFIKHKPDLVIVFGDCTNTLASALSAKELDIPIAHIESGLRSGDLSMPEEVNRMLTDHISTYYFVTEQSGVDNLEKKV